jgi:Tol biopolymer transport system component
LPAAGGAARELLRAQEAESIPTIAWTPDGRHILYGKRGHNTRQREITELWRISTDGGEPQKLDLATSNPMLALRVHPDGRQIAFIAGEMKSEIWALENFLPAAKAVTAPPPRP